MYNFKFNIGQKVINDKCGVGVVLERDKGNFTGRYMYKVKYIHGAEYHWESQIKSYA